MSGFRGGSSGSFTGSGGFSLDITGAGNLNGNAAIDGSFSGGKQSDDTEADIQNDSDQEIYTEYNADEEFESESGRENSELMNGNNVAPGEGHQFDNVNSQAAINQYGMANSNQQGNIMQHALRRQDKAIHPIPKQYIICGYRYKTIYPKGQLGASNVDQSLVGQHTMRRFYSGPFNHLL